MKDFRSLVEYLKHNNLLLATAESCTGGEIMATLSKQEDSAHCLFIGYVVYHQQAKIKELGVNESTIKTHSLTSEEVAKEMAKGAFKHKEINTVIAATGIIGPESMQGIPPGTVCFSWAFMHKNKLYIYSETKIFKDTPARVPKKAAYYALSQLQHYHQLCLSEAIA